MKLKRRDTFGSAIDRVARDPLFGTSADFPRLIEIDLDKISPRADQPRRHFDEGALAELAASMERVRLIHPILVRETGQEGRFELVSGERRWRAAGMLGWPTIFAIVSKGDVDEIALIENLQRQDLNALEEAAALQRLLDKHGFTQEELGAAVGKSQGQVSALLRLLTLPEPVRLEYPPLEKLVSRSLLIELATIDDAGRQLSLWRRARDGQLTVRAIRQEKAGTAVPAAAMAEKPAADGFTRALKKLERDFKALPAAPARLSEAQRASLAALRRRLDEILG